MRFFTAIDFQHLVLAFFLGLAAALVIYLAFRHGSDHGSDKKEDLPGEYADEIRTGDNPVPLLLFLLYVGFFFWLIFYIIFIALKGGPI